MILEAANWGLDKVEDKFKRSIRLGIWAKSTLHTADVLSDPQKATAEKEILVNGGRLQPGCYEDKDELSIKKRTVYLGLARL